MFSITHGNMLQTDKLLLTIMKSDLFFAKHAVQIYIQWHNLKLY